MANPIPVDFYMLLIWKKRRFKWLKSKLLKIVLTLAEILAN